MRNATRTLLKSFEDIKWFANCGRANDPSITPIKSWTKARALFLGRKWNVFKNAISNREKELTFAAPGFHFEESQSAAREIIAAVDTFLQNLEGTTTGQFFTEPRMIEFFSYDLRHILTEVECAELVPPMFAYPKLWPWYERGFMPCGWDGPAIDHLWAGDSAEMLPQGTICVF